MRGLIKSSHCRACIASMMIMVYTSWAIGEHPDRSYNDLRIVLWVLAEVSIGVTISGTFSLPKFVEVEGPKLRAVFSHLTRMTSGRGLGLPVQRNEGSGVTSQEQKTDDVLEMVEYSSVSDLGASTNHDHDVERCPSFLWGRWEPLEMLQERVCDRIWLCLIAQMSSGIAHQRELSVLCRANKENGKLYA